MMRYILPIILLFTLFCALAQHIGSANPISLGTVLVNEPDIEGMKSLCLSRQYIETTPEDGYSVFTSPEGYKIRFKMQTATGSSLPCPIVEISSDKKFTDIDKILTNSGFTETKHNAGKTVYQRGLKMAKRFTTCTILSPQTLLFTKTSPR